MKLEAATCVLYIEPTGPPSDQPVEDDLTARFETIYARSRAGTPNVGVVMSNGEFFAGLATMGVHQCTGETCKVVSENADCLLDNGIATNSLALHYLRYHRSEIPQHDLDLIEKHF